MRPEKKYLVREVGEHLEKSDYVFLADYSGITVDETSALRAGLADCGAEFHVVKNSALKVAAAERNLLGFDEFLTGPTAIVTGGDDMSGTAKFLHKFYKEKDRVSVKVGALGDRQLTAQEVSSLAALPNLEILRAQFLSLLNMPTTRLVTLLHTPARQLATVLKVKAEKGE